MTDKYGSDQDGHEVAADHEQEGASENETWHGDQPPVDDFADHAGEETATVSEETEIHEEPAMAEVEGKKKSIILPIAAAVGGILILGALLYWQFGGSSNSSVTMAQPALKPMSTEPPAMVADNAQAAKPASTSDQATADIANLKSAQPVDVAPTTSLAPASEANAQMPPPMPSPAAAQPAVPPAIAMATAATTKTPSASAAPQVVMPPSNTVVSAPALPSMPMANAAAPSPMAPSPASSTKDASLDARLSVLATHVDDLQKSLNQASQQLNQVSNMMAASTNVATQAQPNAAIEDRLNKIEQQLMQMQHGTPAIASPSMAAQEAGSNPDSMSAEKPMMASGSHKTHKTKHKAVRHEKHSSRKVAQQEKIATPKMHWILRAATPGEAWVATDSASPELRQVHVGDQLPGIGQIRAIHQNGDNWVLEGSEGSVQ